MINTKQAAIMVAVATALGGCATSGLSKFETATQETIKAQAAEFPTVEQSTNLRHIIVRDDYYFGRRSEAVNRDRQLPPLFDREIDAKSRRAGSSVGLYLDSKINLTDLADLIQSEFAVPVRIDPYVYTRSATLNSSANSSAAPANAATSQPGTVANYASDFESNVTVKWAGKLPPLLDRVSKRLGIDWEFEHGVLSFYRFKTQVVDFVVPRGKRTSTRDFKTASDLQSASVSAGGANGGSAATAGITDQNKSEVRDFDYYNSIKADLDAQRSPGAPQVIVNEAFSTITLVDTPARLKSQLEFIEEQKRRLNRHGVLRIDLVRITNKTADQVGATLNGIITAQHGTQRYLLNSPASVLTQEASSISDSVLLPRGATMPTANAPGSLGDGIKGYMGSSGVISALMQWDKDAEHVSYTLRFRNSLPVTSLDGETDGYLASVGSSSSSTSTQTTASLSSLSTGLSFTGTVRIDDSNMASLDFLLNMSSVSFTPVPVNGVQLQNPHQPIKVVPFEGNLRLGETVPISMLVRKATTAQANLGLGGSSNRSKTDETLLVFASVISTE